MELAMRNRILETNQIIKGVKNIKFKPTYNSGSFDKTKPIGEHNFPLTQRTVWDIYGYRRDPLTGIKRPYWMQKILPTGRTLTPKMCGLDGFFDVKSKQQMV